MKKLICFTTILIVIFSCKARLNSLLEKDVINPIFNSEIGDITTYSDAFNILNYSINEDLLVLDISYVGGCKQHTFKLIGSPYISKSLPPIRQVKLIHNSNGDTCNNKIFKTIKINLKPLAYQMNKPGEIYLQCDSWNQKLLYKSNN
jgi:hypothetical protein